MNLPDDDPTTGGKLQAAWLMVLQAQLMLGHLTTAGPSWPEANLYCHACITAMRSVTFLLQKAFRDEPGFDDWYSEVQTHLAADAELGFLRDARNYILKEGALELMTSVRLEYSGPLAFEVRGIGPEGPDVWVREEGSAEWVPADWRRLEGFKYDQPLRLAPVQGLPQPPETELREMLASKILKLRLILHEADARFDAEHADIEVAIRDERQHGGPWAG